MQIATEFLILIFVHLYNTSKCFEKRIYSYCWTFFIV